MFNCSRLFALAWEKDVSPFHRGHQCGYDIGKVELPGQTHKSCQSELSFIIKQEMNTCDIISSRYKTI